MPCYNPSGTIKICKLGYYNGMFGAWPQKTPDEPVLASDLDNLMPFINMPYMLYQNARSSNVSLVTIKVEPSGVYTAKPYEISGLPASDHLIPVSMPLGRFLRCGVQQE